MPDATSGGYTSFWLPWLLMDAGLFSEATHVLQDTRFVHSCLKSAGIDEWTAKHAEYCRTARTEGSHLKLLSTLVENHPDTLSSMVNLAELYRTQGHYDKALPLYITCLEQRKSTLGENHPDTINSMIYLAAFYDNQRQYDKALPLYIKSLEKCKSTLGENHPVTLMAMHNLANCYDALGEFRIARSLRAEVNRDSCCIFL